MLGKIILVLKIMQNTCTCIDYLEESCDYEAAADELDNELDDLVMGIDMDEDNA